jgi:hypothetical protein
MAITFTNLGVNANPDLDDNTDNTSYATASWTPPSSGLIILDVGTDQVAGFPGAPTVTGNSLTWTQIATVTFGSIRRLSRYAANASGSTTGATTFSAFGGTQSGIRASFYVADGTDVDNGVVQTFIQSPTNTGTGSPASVTLSAAADANNRPCAATFNYTSNPTDQAPGASWTELDDLHNFEQKSLLTQYRGDAFDTAASSTWTGTQGWAMIASELKVGAVAAGITLDPFGMSGFFGA